MPHRVSSRFSIASTSISAEWLSYKIAWPITERHEANETMPQNVSVFDLGIGDYQKVDHHLTAVKRALLGEEKVLSELAGECTYALWIDYRFPKDGGVISLPTSLQRFFTFMNVELVFHLRTFAES